MRNTAAKQLAQLAAKSVISDVTTEEDIKTSRQHVSLGDPSAWAELMAVVARVIILPNSPHQYTLRRFFFLDSTFFAFQVLRDTHSSVCGAVPHFLPRSFVAADTKYRSGR